MKRELYPEPALDTFPPTSARMRYKGWDGDSKKSDTVRDCQGTKAYIMAGQDTVSDLVRKAKYGDRAAIGRLIELFRDDLYRLVYYRTQSRMDADDIIQEVFIQMMKKLPTLKDEASFRPWLFRIAVNRVYDFHRKKRILVVLRTKGDEEQLLQPEDLRPSNPETLDHVTRRQFWDRLKRFSKVLSRWEREIFFLRFLDQLTIHEISEVVKKSESSVKTHLYRAVGKFKNNKEIMEFLAEARS